MKKILLIFLSILLICLISACDYTDEILAMPELPVGYKLLCSPEGKYCLQFPAKRYGEKYKSVNVWDSKRKAIKFAIRWEQIKDDPYIIESDKYTWTICEMPNKKKNEQ
ncbi:hypothetical protein KAU11_09950 [Candidatus Babeliales bacterium]|nr:hypothetical protein [Candidatus Babeliales bacterium]